MSAFTFLSLLSILSTRYYNFSMCKSVDSISQKKMKLNIPTLLWSRGIIRNTSWCFYFLYFASRLTCQTQLAVKYRQSLKHQFVSQPGPFHIQTRWRNSGLEVKESLKKHFCYQTRLYFHHQWYSKRCFKLLQDHEHLRRI